MSEIKLVTEYVDRVFRLYNADRMGFFKEYDEDVPLGIAEIVDIPLFPTSEIDEETLGRISIHLGLTKQEILNRDYDSAKKYWDKFPFFRLFRKYCTRCAWYSQYKDDMPSAEERINSAIFDDVAPLEERYDYQSVETRLVEKLKEIDVVMPGTFHQNAEITKLEISTEVFFSFPECTDMIRSYVDMVDRAGELFLKAIKTELPENEICELNFLASQLNIKDALAPSIFVTYENVRRLRHIYVEENLPGFLSYVKILGFDREAPWRCREFFDDMELVQKFVNIIPRVKPQMREFLMKVSKFFCWFVWSDAKPIMFSVEEEAEDFERFGDDEDLYVPIEKRHKEPTRIYIDKTKDEMFDWEGSVEKLSRATSPASMGGLELPSKEMTYPPFRGPEAISRMQKRIALTRGGNLI